MSDDRAVVGGLVLPLRGRGLEVLRTSKPVEALAITEVARPELVLIDVRMPGAHRLCAGLAHAGRLRGVAVAMLTRDPQDVAPSGCESVRFDADDPDSLLRHAEALVAQTHAVRSASPLTGLPGNTAIRLELDRCLAAGRPVALLYVDIDGFKPYNDHYGFLRGDDVIRAVAKLLEAHAARCPSAFVGHVGGDDFVLITTPDVASDLAQAIVAEFDATAPRFYDERDARRGWIIAEDRRGRRHRWPLLTISVGVATTEGRKVDDALALVDVATEMKHVAKSRSASAVAVDRRRVGDATPRKRVVRLPGVGAGWSRRVLAVAAFALVAALPAAGMAAACALPGERLWPAAQLIESTRLALAGDHAADVHAALAARRLGDLVSAAASGDAVRATRAAQEVERHGRGVLEGSGEISDPLALAAVMERHGELLEQVHGDACRRGAREAPCEAVRHALDATEAAHAALREAGSPQAPRAGTDAQRSGPTRAGTAGAPPDPALRAPRAASPRTFGGQDEGGPGEQGAAPEEPAEAPGRSGDAPGPAGAPAEPREAPRGGDDAPGRRDESPGQRPEPPGQRPEPPPAPREQDGGAPGRDAGAGPAPPAPPAPAPPADPGGGGGGGGPPAGPRGRP